MRSASRGHPGLGVHAHLRNPIARVVGQGVLDDAERVEHLHDGRAAPAAGELDRGQARQPVVAVQQRVAAAGPALERFHAVDERVEIGHDLGRGHRSLRTRLDVHDARARAERDDLGNARGLAPREHVDLEPEPTQVARDLADVHVHPAGLLAAERGEGTRVDGDEADPPGRRAHRLAIAMPAASRRRSRTESSAMESAHERRGPVSPRTTAAKWSIIAR